MCYERLQTATRTVLVEAYVVGGTTHILRGTLDSIRDSQQPRLKRMQVLTAVVSNSSLTRPVRVHWLIVEAWIRLFKFG